MSPFCLDSKHKLEHGEGGSGRRQPTVICDFVVPLTFISVPMATLRGLRASSRLPAYYSITFRSLIPPTRWHATHAYVEEDAQVPQAGSVPRRYWSKAEIKDIYDTPLLELVFKAAQAHRVTHDPSKVQLCTLMNIKSLSRSLFPHHSKI